MGLGKMTRYMAMGSMSSIAWALKANPISIRGCLKMANFMDLANFARLSMTENLLGATRVIGGMARGMAMAGKTTTLMAISTIKVHGLMIRGMGMGFLFSMTVAMTACGPGAR